MLSAYFKNARIYGADINTKCSQYAGENRTVLLCDLSDVTNLQHLAQLRPNIIIDDASHMWSHQIKALFTLFPALRHGGLYIVEDLGTNFCLYQGKGYDDAAVTAYDILSSMAEIVTSGERLRVEGKNPYMLRMTNEIESLAMQIEMISFIHESCIIVKK